MLNGNFIGSAALSILAVIPIVYFVEGFVIRGLYGSSIDYASVANFAVVLVGVDAIE